MGKKRAKATRREGIPSTAEGRALAEKNAAILREAFAAVGIQANTYVDSPWWMEPEKMPQEVTVVELCEFCDGDGEHYTFMFGHNNGECC